MPNGSGSALIKSPPSTGYGRLNANLISRKYLERRAEELALDGRNKSAWLQACSDICLLVRSYQCRLPYSQLNERLRSRL